VEERLLEVERRYDEAKEIGEAETRRARDEGRRRKRADARIGELTLQGRLIMTTLKANDSGVGGTAGDALERD